MFQHVSPKLVAVVALVVLVFLAVPGIYFYEFHGPLSSDQEVWAAFGGYIGGLFTSLTLLGLIYTIHMQIRESRWSRDARAVDLVLAQEGRFDSPVVRQQRRTAAEFLLQCNDVDADERADATTDWSPVDDIVDFFQSLGTITRLGHINTELVHKMFFPWIYLYCMGARTYLEREAGKPGPVWKDAKWLFDEMCREERTNGGERLTIKADDWRAFMAFEATVGATMK